MGHVAKLVSIGISASVIGACLSQSDDTHPHPDAGSGSSALPCRKKKGHCAGAGNGGNANTGGTSSGGTGLYSGGGSSGGTTSSGGGSSSQVLSIGFWTPWGDPQCPISKIEWSALTHAVHYAALVNADGSLDLEIERIAADADEFVGTAHAHGKKALLGLFPNFEGKATNFHEAATNHRSTLIANTMSLVEQHGYDGVDVDWEPIDTSASGAAAQAFFAELRAALGSRLLTTDVVVTDSAFWAPIAPNVDRVNIMTYDLVGNWNPYTWFNSALYDDDDAEWSIDLAVARYAAQGIPKSKISVGIPFFGYRTWGGRLASDLDQGITGPRQIWDSSYPPNHDQRAYNKLFPEIASSTPSWDGAARVPFVSIDPSGYGDDAFLTYDDAASIKAKIQYVKDQGLGGWIIWAIDQDYFPNAANEHPLSQAVAEGMALP